MLIVTIGGQAFALPIQHVRRILDPKPVAPLPAGSAPLFGLIDFEGQSVPIGAIDTILGIPKLADGAFCESAVDAPEPEAELAVASGAATLPDAAPDAASQPGDVPARLLILERHTGARPVAITVDRVDDVIDAPETAIEALPQDVVAGGPLTGVIRLDGAIALVLSATALLDRLTAPGSSGEGTPDPKSTMPAADHHA
ncbi:MAG: chemotaxis protein CheW [Pseudomonadota bacterium]